VSTVFLGLDHGFFPDEPPMVFETMIFGGPLADYCQRYSTLLDAKFGHWRAKCLAAEAQSWHANLRRALVEASYVLFPATARKQVKCWLGLHNWVSRSKTAGRLQLVTRRCTWCGRVKL
jgi:hypothetical protein